MGETELLIQSVRELEKSLKDKFALEDGYIVERGNEEEKKEYLKLILHLFQPVLSGILLETVYLPLEHGADINLTALRSIIERPSILAKGTPANGLMKGTRFKVEGENSFDELIVHEKAAGAGKEGRSQNFPDSLKSEEKA